MFDNHGILQELARLEIPFRHYTHGEHYTADDALRDVVHWPAGAHVKNLLVKDKARKLTLITVLHQRKVDLVKLGKHVGSKDRWSFADEATLLEVMGVKPGSVSPLGLANAASGQLDFILDAPVLDSPLVYCHPLINTQTVALSPHHLIQALSCWQHTPRVIDLGEFSKA